MKCQPSGKVVHKGFQLLGSVPSLLERGQVKRNLKDLTPAMPTLVQSPFNMLHKGCSGRRTSIHGWSFLGKKVLSSFINARQTLVWSYSRMVNRSSLATPTLVIWYGPVENVQNVPQMPSKYPMLTSSPCSKWRNCVTPCIGMKHWQSLGSAGANRSNNLMNRYVSEILACPKRYPKLLYLQVCYYSTATDKTTTSVSTVCNKIFRKPLLIASARWESFLCQLLSSWLQGARWLVSCGGVQTASEPFVVTICLFVTKCLICFTKKANNSVLFPSSCRNCWLFFGKLVDASTIFLIPFPCLFLVWDFRLV